MHSGQIPTSKLILVLILALFTIKGVVLGLLMPLFQNPDEQLHYATIQYLAEPKTKNWPIATIQRRANIGSDISTYGFSEETIKSAQATQFDEVKFERQNIQNFSDSNRESATLENGWKHYIDTYPTNVSGTKSVYYLFASWLERLFSSEDIFVRVFLMRMLATLFGLGTVILAYLISRKIGLPEHVSLLFTVLVAFQPQLAVTAAQVNIDIALIFSFTLFLYAGAGFLKSLDSSARGLARNDKEEKAGFLDKLGTTTLLWAALAIFAAALGVFSKGPGIMLIGALYPLFAWGAYRGYAETEIPDQVRNDKGRKKKFFIGLAAVTVILVGAALLAAPKGYFASITNANSHSKFDSPIHSIGRYLEKTLNSGEFHDTSLSYWGHFGWLDTPIPEWALSVITWIEIVGFVAILVYLLVPFLKSRFLSANWRIGMTDWVAASKTPRNDGHGWLPDRKYLVFFLGMILALQFAIRFYDWRIFDTKGQIIIGQPGRYFLPNLVGHLILVFTGLGVMVSWIRFSTTRFFPFDRLRVRMTDQIATSKTPRNDGSEKAFETVVKVLALGMILLQVYTIVNVIIPRYYL